MCIGATFALQEAVIALGVLASRYLFDCTEQTNPWPVQKLTVRPEGGLPMRVTSRIRETSPARRVDEKQIVRNAGLSPWR